MVVARAPCPSRRHLSSLHRFESCAFEINGAVPRLGGTIFLGPCAGNRLDLVRLNGLSVGQVTCVFAIAIVAAAWVYVLNYGVCPRNKPELRVPVLFGGPGCY